MCPFLRICGCTRRKKRIFLDDATVFVRNQRSPRGKKKDVSTLNSSHFRDYVRTKKKIVQRPRPKWAKKGHFGLNDEHFTTSFVSPNSPYHCTGRIFDLSVLIPSYIVVHMMWWYHCGLTTCLDHLLYYLLEAWFTP